MDNRGNWEVIFSNTNSDKDFAERAQSTGTYQIWLERVGGKDSRILDQGCSWGRFTFAAYELGYRNIIGMDFSEKLVAKAQSIAKKKNYGVAFKVGDIRKMPFPDNEFDIVLSPGVVEHIVDTEIAIAELFRVLKHGGFLLINVPHRLSLFTVSKYIKKILGNWRAGYERSFTKNHFRRLLNDNGFEILEFHLNPLKVRKGGQFGRLVDKIDTVLRRFGFGGHHMCFLCSKKVN